MPRRRTILFSAAFLFQFFAEKFLFMLFAALHVAFFARQAGVAHFVEPFGVAVNRDLPLDKRRAAQSKQNHGIDVRNQDQEAVLKKAVPVIDAALVAAARTEKQFIDGAPAEHGVKNREIRQREEKENPLPTDYPRQIQDSRNAHIAKPEKHGIHGSAVAAPDETRKSLFVTILSGLIIF